ncbi:DUF2829 domain-containing protein [Xenorhabdus sp. Reich]|uniref:DUF2829 domain-containing protein n=1 Tax=Xenorhabdus littoralis TaxID=2582835 RepID=A0ABU4SLE0_9GAMM|nr:MW1434 family type I TA system toxin [Xenorhabdus sp. Reich]MDX7999474.1 DUF2829 domain-containing protein [Xenorhabdus sp. Reich]
MSEINKPDNLQTVLKCPLNPDQYKSNEIVPIGSFPWAMIQIYLGRRVHRRAWDVADAYIRLLPASGGFKPLLEKYDKEDGPTIWTPIQDDLVECDWDLLKADSQPDIQCPFNPSQYKLAAIEGSLPWAFIQMYLGKKVHRNGWHSPDEYLYFVPKGKRPDGGEENAHIEIMPKDGHFESWTPTQEDLMACDWKLVKTEDIKPKPVDCMLSFDLKVGTKIATEDVAKQLWGYLADEELTLEEIPPFGDLTNFQNKTDIKSFPFFVGWGNGTEIDVRVSSGNNQEGYQKMKELFGKELTVIANGVSYSLGRAKEGFKVGQKKYEFTGLYTNDDATKLTTLLKQNVDNTLHFCFNWK